MRRPMIAVAVLYGGGVAFADQVPCPATLLLVAGLLLACAAVALPRPRSWLLVVLLPLAGAANLTCAKAVLSPHDLRKLLGEEPRIVRVRGVLSETPYHRVYVREERESWHSVAQVEVQAIQSQGAGWQPANGTTLAFTPGIMAPSLFGGRRIEVEGVLAPPKAALAPGLFDYRAFLARQGIYYRLTVTSSNDWTTADEPGDVPGPPIADRFGGWAMATLARGLPQIDGPLQLLWAMSLGWKTALNGEVAEPFMRSGTMHVFAISGLHIALIASLLVTVLRVGRAPRWLCGLLVIPLIWAYTGVTGWQASAIRSTIMASVILAGWSLRRPSDLLNSLAAAAFLILLWDPQQLFQTSFQLSFSVVLSLALITPTFDDLRARWLAPDPMRPAELRPRWHGWVRGLLDLLLANLSVSLAAWLGSLPLIACYFHLFTPISLPANLVVVPLSSAALACNLGSLATAGWLSGATVLLNHAAWFFMVLMIRASDWAAQCPGGALNVPTPSWAAILLYYAVLACLLRPRWWSQPIRPWICGAIGSLAGWVFCQWLAERASATLTLLPLNGGESAYLRPAHGQRDLLVDCGNDSAVEFVIKPFLRAQGVNRLDGLLLTHGDVHNVGGAGRARELFAPRQVYFTRVAFRSSAYREQVRALERIPRLTHPIGNGDRVNDWSVLHPGSGDHLPHADDNTAVLRGQLSGCRVLLLSDLGKPGQNLLLARHSDLRADVVVSGIPGHTEPLAESLLDAIQPRLIVVTDAEYPAPQRASSRLRERLAERDIPVLYTRETGAVTLTVRAGRCRVTTMNGFRCEWAVDEAGR